MLQIILVKAVATVKGKWCGYYAKAVTILEWLLHPRTILMAGLLPLSSNYTDNQLQGGI